jgi:hypothetical protein
MRIWISHLTQFVFPHPVSVESNQGRVRCCDAPRGGMWPTLLGLCSHNSRVFY